MDTVQEADWVLEALRRHLDGRGVAVDDVQVRPFVVAGSIVSTMYLADVTEAGSRRRLSWLCKLLEKDKLVQAESVMVMHYLNEVLFFDELLPFLSDGGGDDISRLFPRFHFAHRDQVQCLIAMDDLASHGYKTGHKSLDLPHATLALQALGRFHALSYVAKKRQPEKFHHFLGRLH